MTGCNCNQGRLPCSCGREFDMWWLERTTPWVRLLYAAVLVGSIVAFSLLTEAP